MKINSVILEALKKNNNIITTTQAIELGFSRYLLSKYEKEGLLERARQGAYVLPDSIHDDMYTLMLRFKKNYFFSLFRVIFKWTIRKNSFCSLGDNPE